jgi:hypothetical protein
MATASSTVRTTFFGAERTPAKAFVQKLGTVIYKGTQAMHVAGVVQPATTGVANSVYLGIAEDTYDASAEVANKTWTVPMIFHRRAYTIGVKSGDAPTAADLGSAIYVNSDIEVKHTSAANDVTVRLLSIVNSTTCIVEPV